jgi:glucose/arabinose dehydrogenase
MTIERLPSFVSPARAIALSALWLVACGGAWDNDRKVERVTAGNGGQTTPAPPPAASAPPPAASSPAATPAPAPAPGPTPAPPRDMTPTSVSAHAGATQGGTVNSEVATKPAVRVTTRDGLGVSGITVNFGVVNGGGNVNGGARTTDANGVASVGGWVLGNSVGEQRLSARMTGLPEVTFSATATPAPGMGTLERDAGSDGQTAAPAAAVTVAPAVRVRDAAGRALAGVTVRFAVSAGGGTVQNTSAASDGNGVASAGRWTLGPNAGTNTVTANADGFTSSTFSATALAGGAPSFTRSVWLTGLAQPWDIAFAPDGAVLYTERTRGLSVRVGTGAPRTLFRPADLVAQEQSGMLGVALDPDFAANRTAYVYMASNAGGATDNRIVRFVINADYTAVASRTDIVTGISYSGGGHSGGRLRFGPDGLLYATTGDNRTGTIPQDLAVLGSKVLRVTRDGTPAAGNNTPSGGNPRIYTWGHRNPQGLAFKPAGGSNPGRPYLCEHGPGNNDEVTPLAAGGNGGWDPKPNGGVCPDGSSNGYCGYNGATMTDTGRFPQALRPAWTTGGASQGLSGCGFVTGAAWRDWNGALAVALLSGRRLEVLRLNADGTSATGTRILDTLGERLRHVQTGPDGALWVLTDGKTGGDEIWRVVPNP